jgi:peptide/nickel transport system substrate-binding protein
MQVWGITRLQDKPVYSQNREKGDYHFIDTFSAGMNTMMIGLNMTHKDPALREVFQNKDFRIGLSHAINRQEIIDVVFQSQGEPWQGAPRPESPFHNGQLAKQYTEYDVDLANEHLDRAGYAERDGEKFRLGPDGKRISFTIEVMNEGGGTATFVDSLELIRGYWEEVGVDMSLTSSDRTLWSARKDANDHDAAVWVGDGGMDLIILPRWYAPLDTWGSLYGLPWAIWYASGGEEGEEPPEAAKRQMDLYDRVSATANPDEQARLLKELLQIAREEFWAIGVNLDPPGYGIVKNNFHNVPEVIQAGYMYPHAAPTNPPQYFIE